MDKSKAVLDFGKDKATLYGQEVRMCKQGAEYFGSDLLKENKLKYEVSSMKQPKKLHSEYKCAEKVI